MTKSPPKTKLTNTERHERFKEAAREVEASEKPEDFETAFAKVAAPIKSTPPDRS